MTETPFGSRYLLGDIVGRGAMGRVHRATSRETADTFAVKVLRDDLATQPEVVARFIQERQLLRSVDHDNVVKVHDLVVEGDQLGIVMDFVAGGDLRRAVPWPVPPATAVALAAQVADGLDAIHAADVIHRDLKPENILVEGEAPALVLKLTDFGVSRLVGHTITRVTSLIGTPGYLAPEVANGERPGPAADVYALGIILYELLTGEPPFRAENPMALLRAHAEDEVPRPDDVPEPLWLVLAAALSKQPGERPSAAELATTLRLVAPSLEGLACLEPVERTGTMFRASASPKAAAASPALPDTLDPNGVHDGGTVVTSRAAGQQTPLALQAPAVATAAPPAAGRRKLLAGAIVGAVVLLAGLFVAIGGRDGDRNVAAAAGAPRHAFAPVAYEGGVVVARTWTVTSPDNRLGAELTFTHSGDAAPTVSHFEVIPKSVAEDVDDIAFDPEPTEIVERDPVVRYDLADLAPGESRTVRYEVELGGSAVSQDRLDKLAADQLLAANQYATRNAAAAKGIELTAMAVDPASIELPVGASTTLSLGGVMSDGSEAVPEVLAAVVVVSSSPGVASVEGLVVTGRAAGNAVLTAQAGTVVAQVPVVVTGGAVSEVVTAGPAGPARPEPSSGGSAPATSPPAAPTPAPDEGSPDPPDPTPAPAPAPTAAPTTASTVPPPTPPTTNLTSVALVGDRHIRGSFTVTANGAAPTRCVLVVQGRGEYAGSCSAIEVSGLAYSTTYTVYAYAENSAGRGPNSNSRTVTTNAAPPPPPPPPTISLSRGGSAPAGYWYSVVLSNFSPGSTVTVACHDSRDRNFHTQNFVIGGDGRASDSTLCYSADGPDHWVTGGGVESNHVSW